MEYRSRSNNVRRRDSNQCGFPALEYVVPRYRMAEAAANDKQRGKKMIRKMAGNLWRRKEARLTDSRTRFLPDGDLLLMGPLHHDHAADCSSLHKLHAPAEEG